MVDTLDPPEFHGTRLGPERGRVESSAERAQLTFHPQTPFPVSAAIKLVQNPHGRYKAPADFKLTYTFDTEERRDTLVAVRMVLQRLAELQTDALDVQEPAP